MKERHGTWPAPQLVHADQTSRLTFAYYAVCRPYAALALLDIRPRIAVRVESYLAVPHFVAGTDRIALMQERLAARLADRMDLRVLECPWPPRAHRRGAVVAPPVRGRYRARLAAPPHHRDRPPPLTM